VFDRTAASTPFEPLPPLALAFGVGVAAAAWISSEDALRLTIGLAAFVFCVILFVQRRPTKHWMIVATLFAGAARYDLSRSDDADPARLRPTEERRLTRLRGTVARPPISDPADAPSPLRPTYAPTTRIRIDVETQFESSEGWRPASGRIDCNIPTASSKFRRGDRVEVFGWLSAPSSPMNDGEFNSAERLRRQGVMGRVFCETAEGVLLLEPGSPWTPLRMRDAILDACHVRLQRWMPVREASVAEAAVLGARTSIRREDLEPWVNSGTLHMLVVSGWHVAVVAAAAWGIGRFLIRARSRRAIFALVAIWAYTMLTGSEAPAVRAAVFTSMYLGGVMLGRPFHALNALAAGVLILLVVDPQQLFQTGAQLSVLAVMGLLLFPQRLIAPLPSIDPDLGERYGWRARWKHGFKMAIAASVCAWAATAPLVAQQFHLFSPASIWLSVILAPVLTAAIGCSVMVLLLADLPIAAPFAWGAEWCIKMLNAVVAHSEWLPGGFYFCSGPPLWWAAGMLALVWIPFVACPRWLARWLHGSLVVSWSVLGLVTWSLPTKPDGAAFHQLSVGHGNAAVLQTPDGRVFLVDCGSMTYPGVGERIIAPFLWRRGIQTVDAVFVSHADVDHFNGLPALLSRFRVGAVYTPPQFARMEQPAVKYVSAALRNQKVPLRFVWAGDRMTVGDVELEALWPTATARGRSDNSNSLVLDARCRGRSVLSTGDLAEEGLRAVMRMEHPAVDLFVIPHHGGRSCNPPELAAWAAATVAVGSQHGKSGDSMGVYRDVGTITARTDVDGALSMHWQGDELLLTTFRTGRRIRVSK
jgi:competence protein ComEC